MLIRSLTVWVLLLVAAIANGAVREVLLARRMSEPRRNIVSTLCLVLLVLVIARATMPWIAPRSLRDAMFVGTVWCALTLMFEFLAGHFLFKKTWEMLLAEYRVTDGRIWVLVPLATVIAPFLGVLAQ